MLKILKIDLFHDYFYYLNKMRSTRKLIEKNYLRDKLVQNQDAKPQQEKPPIQPTPPDSEREHIEDPQKQYSFFITADKS